MAMNVVQRSAAETRVSTGSGGLEWLDSLPVGGEGTIVLGFKACCCSSGSWWWCHVVHGPWPVGEKRMRWCGCCDCEEYLYRGMACS